MTATRHLFAPLTILALALIAACGGAPTHSEMSQGSPAHVRHRAQALLDLYNPLLVALYTENVRAEWAASTHVGEGNTGLRTGADTVFQAFAGNAELIRRARELYEQREHLDDLTSRQIRRLLYLAASAPQTNPELARRRVSTESQQAARLDSFQFCLDREGDTCNQPVTTNDIDRVLRQSRDLGERLQSWNASKEVGAPLREGIVQLQALRNGVAQEMGYRDFYAFQVDDYGMTPDEMMAMLDQLVTETRPLFVQLHCWTRYQLAERYGVTDVPQLIPAHWIGNRWGQSWPGLVDGIDRDAMFQDRSPEWVVEQAERFYVSMGFPALPRTFYTLSDLYPVPDGEEREKNDHASAWHVDLGTDVRSLMSVEADWMWFGTTHHELGHIYYYLAYARPEVPPLLRRGANRAFHEGIGSLIELAASQQPYLEEIQLATGEAPDQIQTLLDSALTGPIVFMPFSAGTMSHFEKALYSDNLPAERFQSEWWELVSRYQGIAPPAERDASGCDACTKTHINNDPGQYYDYALSEVILHQLHRHICQNLLQQDPHACNYLNRREAGDFLRSIMEAGATRDWREVLQEATGEGFSAAPMLEYYRPLMAYLEEQNQGRQCDWAAPAE